MGSGSDFCIGESYYVVFHPRAGLMIAFLVAAVFFWRNVLSFVWPKAQPLLAESVQVRALKRRLMGRNMALLLAGFALLPADSLYLGTVIFAAGIFTAIIDGLVVMFSESPEASIRYWIYAAAMLGVVMLVLT